MAAKVSTGGTWPDGTPCKTGNIIFLSAEDDGIQTSRIEFEKEPVNIPADDALITDNDERTALDDAKDFLREILSFQSQSIASGLISDKHLYITESSSGFFASIIAFRTASKFFASVIAPLLYKDR